MKALLLLLTLAVCGWGQPPRLKGPSQVLDLISVKDYGASGDGVTDDTVPIQNAINALIRRGGGTLTFPPGIYTLATVTTDAYGSHALLIDGGLHVRLIGYGATLKYQSTDNLARALEIRGTGKSNIEGLAITSANPGVGTGISLRRPTFSYHQPVADNAFRDLSIDGFNLGLEVGTAEGNQVSENVIQNIHLTNNRVHLVQSGASTFNITYINLSFTGGSIPNQVFIDLETGTATFIRPTLEAHNGTIGIVTGTGYVGPASLLGLYAELTGDSTLVLKVLGSGSFISIRDSQISMFDNTGTAAYPIVKVDLSAAAGGSVILEGTNLSNPDGGYKAIKLPAVAGPTITRVQGYWSPQILYSGPLVPRVVTVSGTGIGAGANGYSASGNTGMSVTNVVSGRDGNSCTMTFTGGLLTASTCH